MNHFGIVLSAKIGAMETVLTNPTNITSQEKGNNTVPIFMYQLKYTPAVHDEGARNGKGAEIPRNSRGVAF